MAEALARDGGAPIRGRVAGTCALHRRRWGLARWLPDDRAVQRGYAARRAELAALAVLYARRCEP